MSEMVPKLRVADKMVVARRQASVTVAQMAEYLEVSPITVNRWERGERPVRRQTLAAYALRCRVSFEWLRTDETVSADGNGDGKGSQRDDASSRCTARDLVPA